MSEDNAHETLLAWLQEAHAMARHGETLLSARGDDLEDDYPELAARLAAHAKLTARQAERLTECIEHLGERTSAVKNMVGKVSAVGHSLGTRMAGEEAVQAHAASYAFEHFEIANYRAMVAAADRAGEPGIKATCQEILAEQQEMADWLGATLDETTRAFLA